MIVTVQLLLNKYGLPKTKISRKKLAVVLADAYAQDWVGTEDHSETVLDTLLREGYLQDKRQYGRRGIGKESERLKQDYHYYISQKGLAELRKTNFPFGSGSPIDTRKIHF